MAGCKRSIYIWLGHWPFLGNITIVSLLAYSQHLYKLRNIELNIIFSFTCFSQLSKKKKNKECIWPQNLFKLVTQYYIHCAISTLLTKGHVSTDKIKQNTLHLGFWSTFSCKYMLVFLLMFTDMVFILFLCKHKKACGGNVMYKISRIINQD